MRSFTTKWTIQDHLNTPKEIAGYLEATFEDGDPKLINAALGDVARAKGLSQIAREAEILYARLLYHQDFPVDSSLEDVRAFWEKHAIRIWQELVTEGVHK
jgi:probable addiction module antidote protein